MAAQENWAPAARVLLAAGADAALPDGHGATPLHYAAKAGATAVAESADSACSV